MTANLFLGTITIGFLLGTLVSWGINRIYRVERIMELRECVSRRKAVGYSLALVIQELGQLYLARGDIQISRCTCDFGTLGTQIEFEYWVG